MNIDVVGIVETKVRIPNHDKIQRCFLPNWTFVNNSQPNSIDRIWVGCNPDKVNLRVSKCSNKIIYNTITLLDNALSFEASFIYGSNNAQHRKVLWNNLIFISASIITTP